MVMSVPYRTERISVSEIARGNTQNFQETVKVSQERFKPESKKELYQAELQTCTKKRSEEWAVFRDDLKLLTDRAYLDLPDRARERFTLNQYLSQLDNEKVAFEQVKLKAVDEAVHLTLEMESYIQLTSPKKIAATLPAYCESDVTSATSTQP